MDLKMADPRIPTQKELQNGRMIGELIKNKGNEAFKNEDYEAACSLYTSAAAIDPDNARIYLLNRSFGNLRLSKWAEAENDASTALSLAVGVHTQDKQKALYRRCQARCGQGRMEDARSDLEALLLAGGKPEDVDILRNTIQRGPVHIPRPLIGPLAMQLTAMQLYELESRHKAYVIKQVDGDSQGAFATRSLRRGDQILAEKPLFRRLEGQKFMDIVKGLPYDTMEKFLSLRNSYLGRNNPLSIDHLYGIFITNAFYAENLCLEASRFNHSCRPNARYSWHEEDECERIYALCDIAKGEEIFVTYLSGMTCYGKTRAERQKRLSLAFSCTCSLCSADEATVTASDARRKKISALWEGLTTSLQAEKVLKDAIEGIRLMQEEGYYADADDFAVDAAGICQVYADWESAKYWAKFMYETRAAEFGEDHKETRKAKAMMENPSDKKWHAQSGFLKSGKSFSRYRL